jgi:glycosyltransferase involved in cell wall biosynthesis
VSKRKGQEDLIKAIERFDAPDKAKLVTAIVGFNESAYSREISNEVTRLKQLGHRIIDITESRKAEDRKQVAELYLAADIFVMTSRVESYPRVTLEAMCFGLPVISTPCFGVTEQLVEDESGLFYNAGDHDQLYTHLISLSRDLNRRVRMANAASEQLTNLNSYDQMLDAYEDVYRRVIEKTAASTTKNEVFNGY